MFVNNENIDYQYILKSEIEKKTQTTLEKKRKKKNDKKINSQNNPIVFVSPKQRAFAAEEKTISAERNRC